MRKQALYMFYCNHKYASQIKALSGQKCSHSMYMCEKKATANTHSTENKVLPRL